MQLNVIDVSLPTSADILAIEGAQSLRRQRVSSGAASSSSLFSADRFSTKLEESNLSIPSMSPFGNNATGSGAASSSKRKYVPFHSLLVAGAAYRSPCQLKTAPATAYTSDDDDDSFNEYESSETGELDTSHTITSDFSRFQLAPREMDNGDDLDTSIAEFSRF